MAKKVVATLRSSEAAQYVKVIKMVKSPKTGAYCFKDEVVLKDQVNAFLSKK